jgi:16S rRNA (uracil1498-N3)-methyltransferase
MVRLYIDSHLDTGKLIPLQEHQGHYLRNVLRLTNHDSLQLFNERDGEWLATLETLSKSTATAKVSQCLRAAVAEAEVTLLFAPLKPDAMHYLIEKATELGVSCLQPLLTEFTQISKINREKITRYCVAAAEQCERLSLPHLGKLTSLKEIGQSWAEDTVLIVCLERQESMPLAQVLQQLSPAQKVAFLIGPEGGLSGRDIGVLSSYPFVKFCRMGPRILRAETAAIAALSCFQALRGDW